MLRFQSLQGISGLRHAVTTRGDAGGPFDALNLAYHVGDEAARVTENRQRVATQLGYDAARLVSAQQVHGSSCVVVTEGEAGRGAFGWRAAMPACDALIVAAPNLPVLIQVADCAPLLLVDPQKRVLAAVHAGWRGAVGHIAKRAIAQMQAAFRTVPGEVRAGIGPCLCANCFEIGPEVVAEANRIAPEAIIAPATWGNVKPHLDLRLLLQRDLQDAGVPAEQIETMPFCPRCQNDIFFSHRGQDGTAGRFGLVAWWEN